MPHLTAEALTDDPDGLGFLRAVLDQPSGLGPNREFVPTLRAQLTPIDGDVLREAQPDCVVGLAHPQIRVPREAPAVLAYSI
jgi:hypothetical protein